MAPCWEVQRKKPAAISFLKTDSGQRDKNETSNSRTVPPSLVEVDMTTTAANPLEGKRHNGMLLRGDLTPAAGRIDALLCVWLP